MPFPRLEPITPEADAALDRLTFTAGGDTRAALSRAYDLGRRDELNRWIESLDALDAMLPDVTPPSPDGFVCTCPPGSPLHFASIPCR